jgi:hypothetical protein
VRCIFRPTGLPRRALHFSTGVHSFRDLADRLGVAPPLPDDLLAAVPGAATAGCELHSAE